jgi:hypothetical protein
VWGTKFWYFLNPDAFPIEDSRVDRFFVLRDHARTSLQLRLDGVVPFGQSFMALQSK